MFLFASGQRHIPKSHNTATFWVMLRSTSGNFIFLLHLTNYPFHKRINCKQEVKTSYMKILGIRYNTLQPSILERQHEVYLEFILECEFAHKYLEHSP